MKREGEKRTPLAIPDFVRPFLWSYDTSRIDREKHKRMLIQNVLNFGTKEATDWLRSTYSEEEIRRTIARSLKSSWSKKSLHLWSSFYGVSPREGRFS